MTATTRQWMKAAIVQRMPIASKMLLFRTKRPAIQRVFIAKYETQTNRIVCANMAPAVAHANARHHVHHPVRR